MLEFCGEKSSVGRYGKGVHCSREVREDDCAANRPRIANLDAAGVTAIVELAEPPNERMQLTAPLGGRGGNGGVGDGTLREKFDFPPES